MYHVCNSGNSCMTKILAVVPLHDPEYLSRQVLCEIHILGNKTAHFKGNLQDSNYIVVFSF